MGIRSGKIITTLRERRQIEIEIAELLQAVLERGADSKARKQAQRIAASGDQVIPVILNNLNHSNPQMLNTLGIVSSLYPDRDAIIDDLYEAAADANSPDQRRIAAMLIMERFLGVEPDPYLVGTLSDPQAMVTESIEEMIREGAREPLMLLEYTQGLAKQPQEVLGDIVGTLLQIGKERAVPILCLLAQQGSKELAIAALEALGRLDHPHAVQGLQALLPMLDPSLRSRGEKSLRKLQFKGVPLTDRPPVDERWRALVSSPDSEGNQVVWFIYDQTPDRSVFLGLSITQDGGIVEAYGDYHISADALPPRQPQGYVHSVALKNDAILYMLETSFDYGRYLISEAQDRSFGSGLALPPEYRLMGSLIWQYQDASNKVILEAERQQLRSAGTSDLGETANLLAHSAFNTWFAHGELAVQHALAIAKWAPFADKRETKRWAIKLAKTYFDREKTRQLQASLEAMGEWFLKANQAYLARVTMTAAKTVTTVTPAEHPFTLRMAERGLAFVLDQLEKQFGVHV
jgi:hypothetical protein